MNCCSRQSCFVNELKLLPPPVLKDDQLHYKSYDDFKENGVTTDEGRPSLCEKAKNDTR